MGKSNRIRSKRENERINAPLSNQKKGMPSWVLTLITIVVTVAILFSFVAMMFASNGVLGRWKKVATSENYKVTANMMSYYFATEYNSFLSQYSAYLSTSEQAGMISLNPSVPLKNQIYGGDPATGNSYYDTMFFGTFQGTWYDFFLTITVNSVKSNLIYCEYANANNIALDDNDYAEIESTMEAFRSYMGENSADTYFAQAIAKGVKEKDVRKCLEITLLADKAKNDISARLRASVTDEDIIAKYENNKRDYNKVDYMYYNFKVDYDEVVKEYKANYKKENNVELSENDLINHKDAILDAYGDAVFAAQGEAKRLAGLTSAEEFMAELVKIFTDDEVDAAYAAKVENPTGVLKDSKDKIVAEIIKEICAEINDGKTEANPAIEIPKDSDGKEISEASPITVYGIDTSVEVAKVINDIKTTAFGKVYSNKQTYTVEGATYVSEEDDFSKWAFADGCLAGETKTIFKYDGATATKKEEVTNENGQSVSYVYYLTKAQHRDESNTKNFTLAYFSSEENAKEAINAMKGHESFTNGTFSTETFLAIADERGAEGSKRYSDYQKGGLEISDFDTWLFGEGVTMGSITATPIKDASNGYYIIAVYEQPGVENWKVDVKNSLLEERAEAEYNALAATYPVTFNEKALQNIKCVGID